MADFETNLQRGLLVFLVFIVTVVAAMNYWYRALPAKVARERAAETMPSRQAAHRARETQAAVPANPAVSVPRQTPDSASPPRDSGIPVVELPDGRSIGFDLVENRDGVVGWYTGPQVKPWIRNDPTQEKSPLPSPPGDRQKFTALLLADGRLALIGGQTPRDVVALERKCADCAEEYITFGDPTPAATTDVFDFETGTWSRGPTSSGAGDFAIRLRDGSIFKVGLAVDTSSDDASTSVSAEVADAGFTQWESAGGTRVDDWFSRAQVFESRNGVVMLLDGSGGYRALHWTDTGKWVPWLEGETWMNVKRLDEGHLLLTQSIDAYPPRSKDLIVELP
jgi:hypothetical protein